jgi:hypothetical protein
MMKLGVLFAVGIRYVMRSVPEGDMTPIALAPGIVNQRLPSGPVETALVPGGDADASGAGRGNCVITPPVVMRQI